MATFKVVVLDKRSDGFYSVFIRITQNRKKTHVKTDKVVNDKGVVKGTKEVKDSFVLESCMATINKWVEKLNKVDSKDWTVLQVRDYLLRSDKELCFSDFARSYISSLSHELQEGSVKAYINSLQSLERFAGTQKILFSQMTVPFVESWLDSLSGYRSCKSTYPIFVKKMFKEALKRYNDYDTDQIQIKNNPWERVNIAKMDKAKKKAITMEECRKLFGILPENENLQFTLDVCKMILCLAGINIADLYKMQKADYYDGILHYERKKTRTKRADKAYIEMKVPDMLLPTFEKYLSSKDDSYLFTFHKKYVSSHSMDTNIDFFLRKICETHLNLTENYYTPYTFRHTWATIAQNDLGASYEEIGFALNHISTHKVTMGYVKPDFSRAWELNEKVVEKIFFTNDPSRRTQEYHAPVFEKVEETFELCADAYFMGEVVGHVDGKGYRNTDEVIQQLMDNINDTVPKNCTIQIKVKNVTKNQTKYFERMRDIK